MAARLRWLAAPAVGLASAAYSGGPLYAQYFSKYYGYEGDLKVDGNVQIGQDGSDTQALFFSLTGVDPKCSTPQGSGSPPNACGVHVHAGTSCLAAEGHFWDAEVVPEDPWLPISYVAKDGAAVGENVRVRTFKTLREIEGRTIVVHDATGARVSCALIWETTLSSTYFAIVPSFQLFPGYKGNLRVFGSMLIQEVQSGFDAQAITYTLGGTDRMCDGKPTEGVLEACGIRVHQGTSCTDADAIKDHYRDVRLTTDPWLPIRYTGSAGGAWGTTIKIATGVSTTSMQDRAMVVYDAAGKPIACGIIIRDYAKEPPCSPLRGIFSRTSETIAWVICGFLVVLQVLVVAVCLLRQRWDARAAAVNCPTCGGNMQAAVQPPSGEGIALADWRSTPPC